ncbi:Stemod-13(17)-ene synthase, partial [Dichanthelium oligosanthes]
YTLLGITKLVSLPCMPSGYLEPTKCTLRQLRRRQTTEEQEERIRERLRAGAEQPQPPSPYDTAWVAMVPTGGAPGVPRFPRYVEWIMQNQHDDGSWGLGGRLRLPWLAKDAVSSTLACVLALKTWNVGNEHIRKGLRFIGNNSSCVMDDKCDTPVGFNIVFPSMIRSSIGLGLELPLRQSDVDEIFRLREIELQSTDQGRKAYMAYVAEGLGDIIQDWDEVLAYQSKNGSLFNSPSATSALAIHSRDTNALKYLDLLGNKFRSSGLARSWLQNEEEIIMDMETCAIAFRILRMHGYDITSDVFSQFSEESRFQDSVQGQLNDTKTLLELYKASQIRISEDEWNLENVSSWTGELLKQQLSTKRVSTPIIPQEVEYALQFPFYSANVEPLEHKMNIEHFDIKRIQMRKSAYLACHATDDILALATEEFHSSQSLYQQEVKCIESWVKEVGLDQLKFARTMPMEIMIFMASTVFPSESSDARIASIKNTLLTIVVDDFFDGGGSTEELKNLLELIEKWDAHAGIGFCSKHVEILFYAVYNTSNQIGAKAEEVQNRSVISHITEVWVNVVRAFMAEAEWTRKRYVPTMEEYMPVGEVSFALGPILPITLYLVGPELSEDIVRGPEYRDLLRHTSICARLLNDLQTYEKERNQGYVNSVLLHALREGGSISPASMEVAKREIRRAIVVSRRELLRLVLREDSAIPRTCRELFWNMCKVAHLFYLQGDEFLSLQELMAAASATVHEPLQVTLPSS